MACTALALLAFAGCDFVYGVNRRARISVAPDFACVEGVIRKAPGVDDVQYTRTDGGRPLTWTGIKPATALHTFVYRDGTILGALQVKIKYDGETSLSQHLMDVNRKPPQELIDGSRPVMRWIEKELESECGMNGLSGMISEHCLGVECPPLED